MVLFSKALLIWIWVYPMISPSQAQVEASTFQGKVDDLATRFLKDSGATAASIAVFSNDAWVINSHYGEAKPETRYDLASLTKPLATTLLALWVASKGYGSLDERVSKTIPEIARCLHAFHRFPDFAKSLKWKVPLANNKKACAQKKSITVKDLLRHRSGLGDRVPLEAITVAVPFYNIDPVTLFIESPPVGIRDQSFHYADANFIILQRWLEIKLAAQKKKYHEVLMREIFPQLGLKKTGYFSLLGSLTTYVWAPTIKDQAGVRVHDPFSFAMSKKGEGHAGLYSNLEDIKTLATFWLKKGAGYGLMKSYWLNLATHAERHHLAGDKRGLGWDVDSDPHSEFVKGPIPGGFGHTGYTGASIWIDPNSEIIVIALTNRVYGFYPDMPNYGPNEKNTAAISALRKELATLTWENKSTDKALKEQ